MPHFQRKKSRGPKTLQLEGRARRAPRLLVILKLFNYSIVLTIFDYSTVIILFLDLHHCSRPQFGGSTSNPLDNRPPIQDHHHDHGGHRGYFPCYQYYDAEHSECMVFLPSLNGSDHHDQYGPNKLHKHGLHELGQHGYGQRDHDQHNHLLGEGNLSRSA